MFGAARLSGPTCCCPLSSPWSTDSSVVPGVAASANSAWPRIMFGKLRTSHLLLIVAILAALWWITGLLSPTARQRTFREQLLQLDTASLGSFTIVPALSKGLPPLRFLRKGRSWELAMLNDTTVVDIDPVRSLLGSLANMRALRVAGSMVSVADRYDLGDSTADHLVLDVPTGRIDMLVGRCTEGEDPMTVVSPAGDVNAYGITGRLGTFTDPAGGKLASIRCNSAIRSARDRRAGS